MAEIEWLCQVWGGAGQPLLPVHEGRMQDPYSRLLDVEQVDGVGGTGNVDVELPFRVEASRPWDFPALLIAAHKAFDRWRPIEVCVLEADDPWRPIYAAVLGALPEGPNADLSKHNFIREDLRFEDVIPVQRVHVHGSLADLADRTLGREVITPRQFANAFLAFGLSPDTSFLGFGQDVIPAPLATRRAAGPNLIVAVAPFAVDDLALLWNLRATHGDRRVLPIGVPAGQVTREALQFLQEPGRATMFGLGGGHCYLTSASVPLDQLRDVASTTNAVRAVPYEEVLAFGPAPGRPRSHVSIWHEGRTRLDPLSDGDREVLREARAGLRSPALTLDVQVDGVEIPRDRTMRGSEFWGRFQAGAAQVPVPEQRRQQTVEVAWPSSWTCLAAVAQTRGLDVRESAPGRAAATLVRALEDPNRIRWLGHHGLVSLMYRMAERSGMAWWKRRWADTQQQLLQKGADYSTLEEVAAVLGRDEPVVAPSGEGRAVPFQEFVRALGSERAAASWVSWAEKLHLLVRGANVRCPACGASAWLPMAAIPPPVPCAGCGREILEPYEPRQLPFSYRLGEPLRRVLETDTLGHVFALRWLLNLFLERGLIGAHPGVELVDPASRAVVGEVDVLLLFADGSLVPVEVKRRSASVDEDTLLSMDGVADILCAPWDVLVVTEAARDGESIRTAERRLPNRPRLLLTTDQLFDDHPIWTVGNDPFAWSPRTAEQDAARDKKFGDWLRRNDPDQPWYRVADALLDRSLGASHTRDGPRSAAGPPEPPDVGVTTDEPGS